MMSSTVSSAVKPPDLADLLARHLAERFAVAPHGGEQDDEILHRAAQHRADDDPQRARQVAELRRQHRPHQRTRPGDGGEVVAEDDPLVGGLEIVAVAQPLGRRGALVVERHHARGDELRVEAVADGVGAGRGQHQPDAVDVLAAIEGDAAQTERRPDGDGGPEQMTEDFHVPTSLLKEEETIQKPGVRSQNVIP